jgi:hypothetical protein
MPALQIARTSMDNAELPFDFVLRHEVASVACAAMALLVVDACRPVYWSRVLSSMLLVTYHDGTRVLASIYLKVQTVDQPEQVRVQNV